MFTITNKRHIIMVPHHPSCYIIILIVGFPANRVLENRISSTGANILSSSHQQVMLPLLLTQVFKSVHFHFRI